MNLREKKISLKKWKKFLSSRNFKYHSPSSYVADAEDENEASSDENEDWMCNITDAEALKMGEVQSIIL